MFANQSNQAFASSDFMYSNNISNIIRRTNRAKDEYIRQDDDNVVDPYKDEEDDENNEDEKYDLEPGMDIQLLTAEIFDPRNTPNMSHKEKVPAWIDKIPLKLTDTTYSNKCFPACLDDDYEEIEFSKNPSLEEVIENQNRKLTFLVIKLYLEERCENPYMVDSNPLNRDYQEMQSVHEDEYYYRGGYGGRYYKKYAYGTISSTNGNANNSPQIVSIRRECAYRDDSNDVADASFRKTTVSSTPRRRKTRRFRNFDGN